jgi:hypothetical protein
MRKIREVLRLAFVSYLSRRSIAQSLGMSRDAVADYLVRAQNAGLSWPLPEDLDDQQLEHRLYSSELAMTNAYGGDFDLEFSEPLPIDLAKGAWTLAVDGTSSLEQDPDKVFHGDTIDVTAKVVFEKIGRRVLGEKSIDDAGGSIQDLGDPVDEDPFDFEPDGEEGGAHV